MNSERLESTFIFDHEVFNSRPYLSAMNLAMRSNIRYAIRDAPSQAEANSSFADFAQGLNSYNETRRRAARAIGAKEQTTEDFRSWNGPPPAVSESHALKHSSSDESVSCDIGFDARLSEDSEHQRSIRCKNTTDPESDQIAARSSRKRRRLSLRLPSLLSSQDSLSSKTSLPSGIDSSSSTGQHEKKLLVMRNSQANGSTIIRALEMAYGDVGLP